MTNFEWPEQTTNNKYAKLSIGAGVIFWAYLITRLMVPAINSFWDELVAQTGIDLSLVFLPIYFAGFVCWIMSLVKKERPNSLKWIAGTLHISFLLIILLMFYAAKAMAAG